MQEARADSSRAATTSEPKGQRAEEGPRTRRVTEHQLSRKKRNYIMSGEQPVQEGLIKIGPGNNNLDLTTFLLSNPHQLSLKEARSFQSLTGQPMQVCLRAESRLEKCGEEKQRADGSIQ